MGKNKRKQLPCFDEIHNVELQCDSIEECDFICWLVEAVKFGLIEDFEYQPEPIRLSESVSYVTYDNKKRTLLRDHIYSPDFKLIIASEPYRIICKAFKRAYKSDIWQCDY